MSGRIESSRLATAFGTKYKLLEGYPKGKVTGEGVFTAQEQYRINADDLDDFIAECLPPPIVIGDNVIIPPRRFMPGTNFLVLKELSFEPFSEKPADPFGVDFSAPENTYDPCLRLTLDYETGPQSDEEDDKNSKDPELFLEKSIDISGEFLSFLPKNIETKKVPEEGTPEAYASEVAGDIDNDNLAADQMDAMKHLNAPITKVIPHADITLSWKFVPQPNWDEIFSQLGTVNDRTLPAWFFSAPGSHVMFMGVSGRQQYLYRGRQTIVKPWSLDFKFKRRTINDQGNQYGWQHIFSPDVNQWVLAKRKLANGQRVNLYDRSNFMDLFTQAT